jgi:hypothetical protein
MKSFVLNNPTRRSSTCKIKEIYGLNEYYAIFITSFIFNRFFTYCFENRKSFVFNVNTGCTFSNVMMNLFDVIMSKFNRNLIFVSLPAIKDQFPVK